MVSENQEPFFKVRVMLNEGEAERLTGQGILPGMQAEVMMTSGARTVMSYFLKPVTDQLHRALREQ